MRRADQSISKAISHDNAFGFLRLLFALLVVVGHTPELYDGNRNREILTMLFHSTSFGEVAVDGFFLISGYLITASYLNKRSLLDYALRRVVRIYPAFLVAYAIDVLVVAPLGKVVWVGKGTQLMTVALGAFLLRQPDAGMVFAGQPFPALNGATWTIIYESQCYAIIALLGTVGLLQRREAILALAAAASLITIMSFHPATASVPQPYQPFDMLTFKGAKSAIRGALTPSIRLTGIYLIGSCFYLYRDRLSFSHATAALAFLASVIFLNFPRYADTGFAIFGGYVIFYVAFKSAGRVLARINSRNDVSYGVYLYAWPLEKLLIWFWPGMPMVLAGAITLVLAYGLGWASWLAVERPAMNALRQWQRHPNEQQPQALTA